MKVEQNESHWINCQTDLKYASGAEGYMKPSHVFHTSVAYNDVNWHGDDDDDDDTSPDV